MSIDRQTMKAFGDAFQMGRAEVIDPRDAEIAALKAENTQLRRANKTIHDTLTAEVKRLKRLVGEPVFDPPQWREAEPGHSDGDLPAVGSFHG